MRAHQKAIAIASVALLAVLTFVLVRSQGRTQQAPETSAEPARTTPAIRWHATLQDALAEARRDGKTVFAKFHADWCGYCRLMLTETLSDAEVRQALQGFAAVKIDVDRHPDLVKRYGVGPIPAMFILDADGNVKRSLLGYRPAGEFLEFLARQ